MKAEEQAKVDDPPIPYTRTTLADTVQDRDGQNQAPVDEQQDRDSKQGDFLRAYESDTSS